LLTLAAANTPPLSTQVIKLLSQLAARLPDLVGLLQPNFDESAALLIRQGFAQVRVWGRWGGRAMRQALGFGGASAG
jgi:hypothetical protein